MTCNTTKAWGFLKYWYQFIDFTYSTWSLLIITTQILHGMQGQHSRVPESYSSVLYSVSLLHCKIRVHTQCTERTEDKFVDEIQTKVLRVFLLVIYSHLYSFVWDLYFFKLTQPLTVSVKKKGGKPYRKPSPLPYGLKNPRLKLSRLCPETSTWLYIHEFCFRRGDQ